MADNFKFVQAQPFSLAGAGCTMGATTITLNSFLQIDGVTPLTMTNFGSKGFFTLEPGNGTREEQGVFTGVVQNANGTATLTGISNVSFVSPYTEISGTALSHPGGVKLIITNTAGFYDELTSKDDDETVTGDWTFTNFAPTIPTQLSTDIHRAASIEYVNAVVVAGAPNAATNVKGIVQLATQAQVDARTLTGSTGAALVPTPDLARSTLLSDYKADTGSANAYVITPVPAVTAYVAGQIFSFKAANANTTTSTLNVNGLGVKTINKNNDTDTLVVGDIVANQIVLVEYNGASFQMMNPIGTNPIPSPTGNTNKFLTTTNGVSISYGPVFDYQVFTAGGTWTKPANLTGNESVLVQAWGAGGGGGHGTGSNSGGGGGGGGAFVTHTFRASDLGSTVAVTIGAGGAGTATTGGAVGGNTTFGTLLTAYGGGGGGGSNSNNLGGTGGGGGGVLTTGTAGANGASTSAAGGTGGGPAGGVSTTSNPTDGGFGGASGGPIGSGGGGVLAGNSAYGGAGGGGGAAVNTSAGSGGGSSVWGGGGGGGATASGGTSVFAGAGGSLGGAGSAPAGGGGGANATTSGAGARGEVRVWTIL